MFTNVSDSKNTQLGAAEQKAMSDKCNAHKTPPHSLAICDFPISAEEAGVALQL